MCRHLSFLTLFLLSHAAMAGTIYKCLENGKPSYSDRPCGKATVALKVEGPDSPDPAMLARLERERALVQQIEGDRAEREEQQARAAARAERAASTQKRRCDKLRLQSRWAAEDTARAGRDELDKARLKARRQAEAMALECPP